MTNLNDFAQQQLHGLDSKGLLRHLVPLLQAGSGRVRFSGKTYINLSGNDYLGLAANPEVVKTFYQRLDLGANLAEFAPGATASRLMTGNSPLYDELEQKISNLYGTEQALVFNSGYHGNVGILPALAEKGDLILADKLCHASLIDGMRLVRADTIRYHHLDYEHLGKILAEKRSRYNRVFLVTESVFSMDGDLADLGTLIKLKNQYDCVLYLDEAHAIGVFGPRGLGLSEQENVTGSIDLLFGTFGKALAGQGGFLACSRQIAELLINRARSLIYSTGLPPVSLNWLLFVLDRLPAMTAERKILLERAAMLRKQLIDHGLVTGGASQIVPVVIGDSNSAINAAEKLRDAGYWITAVRPPTVPVNTARLRLSLSAAHRNEDLTPLSDLITQAIR